MQIERECQLTSVLYRIPLMAEFDSTIVATQQKSCSAEYSQCVAIAL